MKTQIRHEESGCTDYLQHPWESCPENKRNHADKLAEALRELSDAIEEQGALEVDNNGNPVSQNAAGRNYERRCVARSKAIKTLAAYEAAQ